jgi:hypothetical protein
MRCAGLGHHAGFAGTLLVLSTCPLYLYSTYHSYY